MKKLLLILIVFFGIIGGAMYFILPSNYNWAQYVQEIQAEVRKQTGLSINIQGTPQFVMRPHPMLKVGRVTLGNVPDAEFPQMVVAPSAEIQFDRGLLFKRQIKIKKIVLKSPHIYLETLPNGKWNWQIAFFDRQAAGAKMGFGGLIMSDGIVDVKHDKYTPIDTWRDLNAELLADSTTGPFFFEGNVGALGTTFGFSLKVDQFDRGQSPQISMRVINAPAEATFTFFGQYGMGEKNKGDVTGTLTFDIRKTQAVYSLFSDQKMPPEFFQPMVGSLKISDIASKGENVLSDFLFKYGQSAASGSVVVRSMSVQESSELQAKLEAQSAQEDDIDILLRDPNNPGETVSIDNMPVSQMNVAEHLLPRDYDIKFIFTKFAADPFFNNMDKVISDLIKSKYFVRSKDKFNADLTFDVVDYNKNIIRQMKMKVSKAEKGLNFKEFSAILPGETRVETSGVLTLFEKAIWDGKFSVTSDNVGTALRWLNVKINEELPDNLLRNFKGTSDIKLAGNGMVLNGFKAELDHTAFNGSFSMRFGNRKQFKAILNTSDFDATVYFPNKNAQFIEQWEVLRQKPITDKITAISDKLKFLNEIDFSLTLNMDGLTWADINAKNIKTDVLMQNGILQINNFSAEKVWNADLKMSGNVSRFGSDIAADKLSVTVNTDAFSLFSKNIGLAGLPTELANSDKSKLFFLLNGSVPLFNFVANADFKAFNTTLKGNAKRVGEQYAYDFSVRAKHDNFRLFVLLFTDKYRPMSANPGAIEISATASLNADGFSAPSFEATVDGVNFNGSFEAKQKNGSPYFDLIMNADRLDLYKFMPQMNLFDGNSSFLSDQAKSNLFNEQGLLKNISLFSPLKTPLTFSFLGNYEGRINVTSSILNAMGVQFVDSTLMVNLHPNLFELTAPSLKIQDAFFDGFINFSINNNAVEANYHFNARGINIPKKLFDNDTLDLNNIKDVSFNFRGKANGETAEKLFENAKLTGEMNILSADLVGFDISLIPVVIQKAKPETLGSIREEVLKGFTQIYKAKIPFSVDLGALITNGPTAIINGQSSDFTSVKYNFMTGELEASLTFKLPEFENKIVDFNIKKRLGQQVQITDNLQTLSSEFLEIMADKKRKKSEADEKIRLVMEKKAAEEVKRAQQRLLQVEEKFVGHIMELDKKVSALKPYADVYQVQRYYQDLNDTLTASNALLEEIRKASQSSTLKLSDVQEYQEKTKSQLADKMQLIDKNYLLAYGLGIKGKLFDIVSRSNKFLADMIQIKTKYPEVPEISPEIEEAIKVITVIKQLDKKAEKLTSNDEQLLVLAEAQSEFDKVKAAKAKVEEFAEKFEHKRVREMIERDIALAEAAAAEAAKKAEEEAKLAAQKAAEVKVEKERKSTIYRRNALGNKMPVEEEKTTLTPPTEGQESKLLVLDTDNGEKVETSKKPIIIRRK